MAKTKFVRLNKEWDQAREQVVILLNPEASLGEKADALDALARLFNI